MVKQLRVQGTQVVRRQPKAGEDAISVIVAPSALAYKIADKTQLKTVDVEVMVGTKQLTYQESVDGGAYFVCGLLNDSAPGIILDGRMSWKFTISADKRTFTYTIGLVKEMEVNEALSFMLTVYDASGKQIVQKQMRIDVTTVKDGVGVKSADVMYAVAKSNSTAPDDGDDGWKTLFSQLSLESGKYVWSATKTTLTDGSVAWSGKQCLGRCEDFVAATEEYAVGDSGTTAPISGWGTSYMATSGKWLWTRTRLMWTSSNVSYVNVVCVGYFGTDGNDGTDGNGVTAMESFFAKSDRAKIADMADITGWSRTFPEADAQQPYVWKTVKTTYSKSATTWSTPELVAVYDGGIGKNLLDNASFTAKANMTAWTVKSQYATVSGQTTPEDRGDVDAKNKKDGRNSWHDTCKATAAQVQCKDILSQPVDDPTRTDASDRRRLAAGTWYTLSFWAKKNTSAGVLKVDAASAFKLSFGKKTVRLTQGMKYTIGVKGNITAVAGATTTPTLVTTVNDPSGATVATLRITEIAETTVTATVTAAVTGDYTISSIKSETGLTTSTVRVAEYTVEDGRDLATFVYPLVADTKVKAIADGEELASTPTDMSHSWTLTDEWKQHTLTFKTRADLSETTAHRVLFRLYPAMSTETWREVWVCMPKLEEGMFATTFVDDAQDATGLDGCITRTTEWEVGKEYRNDSESKVRGVRYWDVVTVTTEDGKQTAWVCRETHVSTEESKPTEVTTELGFRYWEKMNDMKPIRTSFLLAENAVIRFGQANRLAVMDKKGEKVQACLQGTDTEDGSVLWIGGATAGEANFSVGYDGTMRAKNGVFSGCLKKEKTVITPENLTEYCSGPDSSGVFYILWERICGWLYFSGDFSKVTDGNGLVLFFPGINTGVSYTAATRDAAFALLGNTIIVTNATDELIATSGIVFYKDDNGNLVSSNIPIDAGRSLVMTCECGYNSAGNRGIGWVSRLFY